MLGYGAIATSLDCVLHKRLESANDHIGQRVLVDGKVAGGVDLEYN